MNKQLPSHIFRGGLIWTPLPSRHNVQVRAAPTDTKPKTIREVEKEQDPQVRRKKMLQAELEKEYVLPDDLVPEKMPPNAKDGLMQSYNLCQAGEFTEAYKVIAVALEMNPGEETKAMLIYNQACCYSRFRMWKEAADTLVLAINEHGVPLRRALKDEDFIFLRERLEWLEALTRVRGGYSQNFRVDLKTENKAPVRVPRYVIYFTLGAGAVISSIFLATRLVKAFKGYEDVKTPLEEAANLGVNLFVLSLIFFAYRNDSKALGETKGKIWRQEDLSKLQVRLPGNRVVPLVSLQQNCRLLVFAGSSTYVQAMMNDADRVYPQLRERAISIIPIILEDKNIRDELAALKAEFAEEDERYERGFGLKKQVNVKNPVDIEQLKKLSRWFDTTWLLAPYGLVEWAEYLQEQKELANIKLENVFLQVALDGEVKFSGTGNPPFEEIIQDNPPLKSLKTKLTDGRD